MFLVVFHMIIYHKLPLTRYFGLMIISMKQLKQKNSKNAVVASIRRYDTTYRESVPKTAVFSFLVSVTWDRAVRSPVRRSCDRRLVEFAQRLADTMREITMSTKKPMSLLDALGEREDLAEDLHEMLTWITAGIKWVAGTNSGMGVLEANAVKQTESLDRLTDAVRTIGDALDRIADEMANERRRKASVDARDR